MRYSAPNHRSDVSLVCRLRRLSVLIAVWVSLVCRLRRLSVLIAVWVSLVSSTSGQDFGVPIIDFEPPPSADLCRDFSECVPLEDPQFVPVNDSVRPGRGAVVGTGFTVDEPVTVRALAILDLDSDGLAGETRVGLFQLFRPGSLVETVLPAGTESELAGAFRVAPIVPISLSRGSYVAASQCFICEDAASVLVLPTFRPGVDPRVSALQLATRVGDSEFSELTFDGRGIIPRATLGPIAFLAPVPEPGCLWIFVLPMFCYFRRILGGTI